MIRTKLPNKPLGDDIGVEISADLSRESSATDVIFTKDISSLNMVSSAPN